MKDKETAKCEDCKKSFPVDELIWGPDPFAEEVRDDKTPVLLCETCYLTMVGNNKVWK